MSNNRYNKQQPQQALKNTHVALYCRVSTEEQKDNESAGYQTADMVLWLQEKYGFKREQIELIDIDMGVSGNGSISDRKGLTHVYDDVIGGSITHIAVSNVSRLTRDEFEITPGQLIKVCTENHVTIITPDYEYRFFDPARGEMDAEIFRSQAKFAKFHITQHIRKVLMPAKRRKAKRGHWVYGKPPFGYALDQDYHLVPIEPYVKYIQLCFEVLDRHMGNVLASQRELEERQIFFPRYDSQEVLNAIPHGCKMVKEEKKKDANRGVKVWTKEGYAPTRNFLTSLGMNVAYVGWHMLGNTIISKESHPAMVDRDVFWRVFNYLSAYNPDGSLNPHYAPHRSRWHSKTTVIPIEKPLLHGLIFAERNGERVRGFAKYESRVKYYNYIFSFGDRQTSKWSAWSKQASQIDDWVIDRVKERLDATLAEKILKEDLNTEAENDKARKRLTKQLEGIREGKANLAANIAKIVIPELLEDVQRDYLEHLRQEKQLEKDLADLSKLSNSLERIYQLKHKLDNLAEYWHELTREQRLEAIHLCICSVEITRSEDQDQQATIVWRDRFYQDGKLVHFTDTLILTSNKGKDAWLASHEKQLRELVERSQHERLDQLEVAKLFPTRNWNAITQKARRLWQKSLRTKNKVLKGQESFNDYAATDGSSEKRLKRCRCRSGN